MTYANMTSAHQPRAIVTGASSGIGAATVRRLCSAGWSVLAVARREDRLRALAGDTGCDVCVADITDEAAVQSVREAAGPSVQALVNNAGGAWGTDPVATGKVSDWQRMYDVNVIGTLRITQALLPALTQGRGAVLVLSSTAALDTYAGGGGYVAAKHAEGVIARTLRLELVGEPVRVIEIAPGMVQTEEFSLNRMAGDQAAAERVYAGVDAPLSADDVAECVAWSLELPEHVNIDLMVVRPRAQASNYLVARNQPSS